MRHKEASSIFVDWLVRNVSDFIFAFFMFILIVMWVLSLFAVLPITFGIFASEAPLVIKVGVWLMATIPVLIFLVNKYREILKDLE